MLASGHPKLLASKPLCLHHSGSMEVYSCLGLHYFLHVHSMLRNRGNKECFCSGSSWVGKESWPGDLDSRASSSTHCLQCLTALLPILWIFQGLSCPRAFAHVVLSCPKCSFLFSFLLVQCSSLRSQFKSQSQECLSDPQLG